MTSAATETTEWSVARLYERLERLEKNPQLFVLDVRAEDEFDAWKIEGKELRVFLKSLNSRTSLFI